MSHPLIIDLDGTLVRTDTLFEAFAGALFRQPLETFAALLELRHGRAAFKRRLFELGECNYALLPLRYDLIDFIKRERETGREIHLVSAADQNVVEAVCERLGIFDTLKGSDGNENLKGIAKAKYLKDKYPDGFGYAGDSTADVPVWKEAEEIIIAGAEPVVHRKIKRLGWSVSAVFDEHGDRFKLWMRAARLHQWAKNGLLFVPLFLGHVYSDPDAILRTIFGFIAIGLVASGTYLLNDLSDLEADRAHATKCNRPLAAGNLKIFHALVGAPVSIIAGLSISLAISSNFALVVLGYLAITLAYSFRLKRVPLLDTFLLGSLFTLRIVMGTVLAGVAFSEWILTFSMFFFFSLSLAKRHVEIVRKALKTDGEIKGRGYLTSDAVLTLSLGMASAMSSLMILVLYLVFEAQPQGFYQTPAWLWVAPISVALWTLRIWLLAHRGELDDDPVAFAIRDKLSIFLGAGVVSAIGLAIL